MSLRFPRLDAVKQYPGVSAKIPAISMEVSPADGKATSFATGGRLPWLHDRNARRIPVSTPNQEILFIFMY